MEWNCLIQRVSKNISYWSSYVSRKTSLEKEDIYQELTIILWKQYCKNKQNEKEITVYYMQKRLEYGSYRIINRFYTKYNETSEYVEDLYYEVHEREIFKSRYVKEIFEQLSENLEKDQEFKALDILVMILEGKRNKEISQELDIKPNTLSLYIKRKIKDNLKEIVMSKGEIYVN